MRLTIFVGAALATLTMSPSLAGFGDTPKDREQRWKALESTVFGTRPVIADDDAVKLEAPERALDAALVPITIRVADPKSVAGLYLIIDDNPSPLAAHFTFGPDADPRSVTFRVRVNAFTDMHAVAETRDGKLLATSAYVKASGGCSAPMGMSDAEAMAGIGAMKLKVAGDLAAGDPKPVVLMIRHPNFNGMQMNPDTQAYTPARYIQSIDVTFAGQRVFDLATDISLASNPVIAFDLLPSAASGTLKVDVKDSQNASWSRSFKIPTLSN